MALGSCLAVAGMRWSVIKLLMKIERKKRDGAGIMDCASEQCNEDCL